MDMWVQGWAEEEGGANSDIIHIAIHIADSLYCTAETQHCKAIILQQRKLEPKNTYVHLLSFKPSPSLGPLPLPGPPLHHSLLLAKKTIFIIYSAAHIYIKAP